MHFGGGHSDTSMLIKWVAAEWFGVEHLTANALPERRVADLDSLLVSPLRASNSP